MKSVCSPILVLMLLMSQVAFAEVGEVTLLKPYLAPIVINGQTVGSIKLPAGAAVELVSDQGSDYLVRRGGQLPFRIPKDYIVAPTKGIQPVKSLPVQTATVSSSSAPMSAPVEAAKGELQTQAQTVTGLLEGFLSYAEKTAKENWIYLQDLFGIAPASRPVAVTSSPQGMPQIQRPAIPLPASAISTPKTASTQVVAPKVVDHFSGALSYAKNATSTKMSMGDAFRLADLETAIAKAIREKKPLGFIMVWETQGDFFHYDADTRGSYGPSALHHFYSAFNNNLVLVFVRHENELGLVPPAVSQGFSGPDEGGSAPNMAVTDATAQEFIVEIPSRGLDGLGRDPIFAEGAKKIDLWLSTHPDAVTKPK